MAAATEQGTWFRDGSDTSNLLRPATLFTGTGFESYVNWKHKGKQADFWERIGGDDAQG